MYFCFKTYSKGGGEAIAGSMFWLFTLYWYMAFPFKALLIEHFDLELQGIKIFSQESLWLGLVISYLFWLIIFLGYRSNNNINFRREDFKSTYLENKILHFRIVIFIGLAVLGLYYFLSTFGISLTNLSSIEGQNESRVGSGLLFSLSSLLIPSSLVYLAYTVLRKLYYNANPTFIFYFIMILVSLLLVLLGMVQETRRMMGLPILAGCLALFMVNHRYWPLLLCVCVGSIFLSPLLHTLRYSLYYIGSNSNDWAYLATALDYRYIITNIGSTFEGIDHIASYLQKISLFQFMLGVDFGESWVYNFGGAYVPRAIWESKPLIYGSIKEQEFIYPWMFDNTVTPATFPVSFVVDFLFGFLICLKLQLFVK